MNEEAIVVVIILRLLAPLLILRFPITGIVVCSILDWQDFGVLGHYQNYQIIDKLLDFYMLTICAFTVLSWNDVLAKKLALGLFAYRAIGVVLLALLNAEWLLFIFPDLFGFFYIFYVMYVRLSGNTQLSSSRYSLVPIILVLLVIKLIQEYTLHVAFPFPQEVPAWFAVTMGWPLPAQITLLALLPAGLLGWYVWRARTPLGFNPQRRLTKEKTPQ